MVKKGEKGEHTSSEYEKQTHDMHTGRQSGKQSGDREDRINYTRPLVESLMHGTDYLFHACHRVAGSRQCL